MKKKDLRRANNNAWYLMMTLHGEQAGPDIDWELAERNRKLWNAWIYRGVSDDIRAQIVEKTDIPIKETKWDDATRDLVQELFSERAKASDLALEMPDIAKRIDLGQTLFENSFTLEKSVLLGATFSGSRFNRAVYFDGVYFGREVDFSFAHFKEPTDFIGTHFGDLTDFMGVDFGGATDFSLARFGDTADFSLATFTGASNFSLAQFGALVTFDDAVFAGKCVFDHARFGNREREQTCSSSFENVTFGGSLSFESAFFASDLPILSNCTPPDTVTVTAETDHWPLKRVGILGRFDIWLGLAKPRLESKQDPKIAKASAAKLRQSMAKQSLPEGEHFFYRIEMHHAARAVSFWRSFHIHVFEALSNFGYSIGVPTSFLALNWLAGTFIYAFFAQFNLGKAAAFSFSAMFKSFGFQGTFFAQEMSVLGANLRTIAATQTVLAFILLFFLGLGLRTRFRLR